NEAGHANPAFLSAFREGAIAVIVKQFTPIWVFGIERFVANKQIQPTITVIIQPPAGHGGVTAQQSGFLGHIREGAIAVVAQERTGNAAGLAQPTAAHHPDIEQPVIVVIGLLNIEGAYFSDQARFAGSFGECAVAVVMKVTKLAVSIPGGN